MTKEISKEYVEMEQEIHRLGEQIKHIEEIVAMQETVSGTSGIAEKLSLADVVNNAISMCKSSIEKRNIEIKKDITDNILLTTDKNKLLQIIVNLIQNANDAVSSTNYDFNKKISIKVTKNPQEAVDIIVYDNGIGIDTEHLNKIFNFGFTTKPNGHGYGLHSSAIAAKELGGTLQAKSAGIGYGAEFILTLPLAYTSGRFINELSNK